MLAAGIVDPAKVTRSGLQNAASIAGMVLTTECIVADLPEKKDAAPAGGGMGGGDFDYWLEHGEGLIFSALITTITATYMEHLVLLFYYLP